MLVLFVAAFVLFVTIVARDVMNEAALDARLVALATKEVAELEIEAAAVLSVETKAAKLVFTSVFRLPRYVLNVPR